MPGDTVVFHWAGVGRAAHGHARHAGQQRRADVVQQLRPPSSSRTPPPPAMQAADAPLPNLFPQGPGDATQSASNPCYQRSGPRRVERLPELAARAARLRRDAGLLQQRLARLGPEVERCASRARRRRAPYRFMCAAAPRGDAGEDHGRACEQDDHEPGRAVRARPEAARARRRAARAGLLPRSRQGQPPVPNVTLPGPNPVLAGSGLAELRTARSTSSGRRPIKIPVGGSVTWWLIGAHSITFNSDKTNNDIRAVAPDGTVHLNPQALAPSGGPGEPPPSNGGPDEGIHFKVVASSTLERPGLPQLGRLPQLVRPAGDRGLQAHVHEGRARTTTSARCTTT